MKALIRTNALVLKAVHGPKRTKRTNTLGVSAFSACMHPSGRFGSSTPSVADNTQRRAPMGQPSLFAFPRSTLRETHCG